jgi:hypothetical protein
MLSKEYCAGFIDGEGYLGIIKKTSKVCRLGYYYKPVIKIAQSENNSHVLDILKEKYGGHISKTRIPKNPNQRPSRMLEISNRPLVKKLLNEIAPYLIVKKFQAKCLIDFINLPAWKTNKGSEYDKYRHKLGKKQSDLYKSIIRVNRRGLAETE